MDKKILKKIAKDWSASILRACDLESFTVLEEEGLLTMEESKYILDQTFKIAKKISDDTFNGSLENIIKKYYDFE